MDIMAKSKQHLSSRMPLSIAHVPIVAVSYIMRPSLLQRAALRQKLDSLTSEMGIRDLGEAVGVHIR